MQRYAMKHRITFWVLEINLILWLCLCGSVFTDLPNSYEKWIAGTGIAFALLTQHWSFYHIRPMISEFSEAVGDEKSKEQ